jgi:hypothetical protein
MGVIIQNAEHFDAKLANQILQLDSPVLKIDVVPLGEGVGLMSSIARATMELADGTSTTCIVKVIAQTENVEISKGLNFYANEINFYRYLANDCPINTPRCLYASLDESTQDFLLILEDLGDSVAGNQLQGCSQEVMSLAYHRSAELHGRYWGKTEQLKWLNYQNIEEKNIFRRDVIYKPGVESTLNMFGEYFTGNLESTVVAIGEQFKELFEQAMGGAQTVIHGDYRTDNMLLPVVDGKTEIIAVDWQNTTGGNGTHDIAYFSAQSCDANLRGEIELQELRRYYETLIDCGVRNYSFDQCLLDYRLNLMITMITPIAVCGTLDAGNARGMELGRVMLQRSLAALTSMSCHELLS